MREYHALRVNLTPADVDKLENNHNNLQKYIATLRDQLSEGRMAIATATIEGHDGKPVHPSVSGTVTGYVNGVLSKVKSDTSLDEVEHPWTKKKARGAYALAQAAAEEEAKVLAKIAATNSLRKAGIGTTPSASGNTSTTSSTTSGNTSTSGGATNETISSQFQVPSSAPADRVESRRKRRRRQNAQSSRKQKEMLSSHDTSDGLPKTDLQQTFRDVHRNRSMLQDATVSFVPGSKSYSEPLVRPSTAPPPKTPYGALKLLQHVLTYDMYEYKRAPPRELGPGHYDLSAKLPPSVKDPDRMSASFLSPHGHQLIKDTKTSEEMVDDEDDQSGKGNKGFGAPTTFSARTKMIAKILRDQGIGGESGIPQELTQFDRMTRGIKSPTKKKKSGGIRKSSSALNGSGGGGDEENEVEESKIGAGLWDDPYYLVLPGNLDGEGGKMKRKSSSKRLSPLLESSKFPGEMLPFDQQDLFYRPTSPEFKFPSSERFSQVVEPHWKGLGSPFNMEKDLAKWMQSKVYIDRNMPRDGGASLLLEKREEGPRNLDQSFNSMSGNIKNSPITYKPSFDKKLPRFHQGPKRDANSDVLTTGDSDKRWDAYQGSLVSIDGLLFCVRCSPQQMLDAAVFYFADLYYFFGWLCIFSSSFSLSLFLSFSLSFAAI